MGFGDDKIQSLGQWLLWLEFGSVVWWGLDRSFGVGIWVVFWSDLGGIWVRFGWCLLVLAVSFSDCLLVFRVWIGAC